MAVNDYITDTISRLFPTPGYYVEAGAHNGIGDSQTLWLEKKGWRGLCIEPSLAGEGMEKRRKCGVDRRCLAGSDGEVLFREMEGNWRELSGIVGYFYDHWDREEKPHKDRMVEAVTLARMLAEHDAPPVIQFMCLDTEGSEPAILAAHDYNKYRILSIWVEYNAVVARRVELDSLMVQREYRREYDNGHDLLYLHVSVS